MLAYDLDSKFAMGGPTPRLGSATGSAAMCSGYGRGSSVPRYTSAGPQYSGVLDAMSGYGEHSENKHSHIPQTRTDINWRFVDSGGKSAPYQQQFRDPSRSDEHYQRYLQLSGNASYRHPNPGVPRERQGRIGGSWRHIKEVLGYTGSQVCFVDGLVSVYDKETMKNTMSRQPAWRAKMAGPSGYSANLARTEFPQMGSSLDGEHDCNCSKYKGFYTMRK